MVATSVPLGGGTLDNDPAVALLIVTWIVQGLINTNRTGQILRLQKELADLKKKVDPGAASAAGAI